MTYTEKMKFEADVKFVKQFSYTRPSYAGYGYDTVDIYKMEDSEGNVLVWKTTSGSLRYDPTGNSEDWEYPNEGAMIRIKATVKSIGEYNGEPQVNINRVKLLKIVEQTMSWEEKQELEKQKQIDSLEDGDEIWYMPYKQYKESYSDCETLKNSYKVFDGTAIIKVIIKSGRLKESGTRFQHYSGYQFINEKNEIAVYRAVSEDNAYRRCVKEFPEDTWKLNHVFDYDSRYESAMQCVFHKFSKEQEQEIKALEEAEYKEMGWEF